jgi:RNA polymerase sigma-B factor
MIEARRHVVSPDRARERAAASRLINAFAAAPPGSVRRERLRDSAILAWTPLAHRLARRYAADRSDLEDLQQTAIVGLIKAVDGFDPARGRDFVAYAFPMITGEVRRYFRDRCWALRPPRRLHDLYLRIRDARGRLTQRLGRTPTVADVAEDLGVTAEEVLEGLECDYARRADSLSAPLDSVTGREAGDLLGDEDDGLLAAEQHLDLREAIAQLPEREQRILALHFYGNQTQAEIGRQMGLSQMHISRLLRRAVGALREDLTSDLR